MEAEYLKSNLGNFLPSCLAEVSEKRPTDPIEYIANWLLKQKENEKLLKQEKDEGKQLENEKKEWEVKQERLAKRRQEQAELTRVEREKREREEHQRKALEEAEKLRHEAMGAQLPTIGEYDEPASTDAVSTESKPGVTVNEPSDQDGSTAPSDDVQAED